MQLLIENVQLKTKIYAFFALSKRTSIHNGVVAILYSVQFLNRCCRLEMLSGGKTFHLPVTLPVDSLGARLQAPMIIPKYVQYLISLKYALISAIYRHIFMLLMNILWYIGVVVAEASMVHVPLISSVDYYTRGQNDW